MWGNIQNLIASGDFETAKLEISKIKESNLKDEALAILEASVCEGLGDYAAMYDAVSRGLAVNPENYELYYILGNYYFACRGNVNQTYICYENALFYAKLQQSEDAEFLFEAISNLKSMYDIVVKKTAIVIVSYNSCYLQQKNIESIRRTLMQDSYQIVVVDNASTDGVTQWLEEQPDILLCKNQTNVGFAPACNQGVKLLMDKGLGDDFDIFLLNNDTRLALNSLFWLRMGLYENDKTGATGAISNYAGNHQQVEVEFQLPQDYLDYGKAKNIPTMDAIEERVRLSGFAMLVRRQAWEEAGGMDEAFAPGYFEDDALSAKIASRGYRLCVCNNSFIYHAGSQSFSQDEHVNEYLVNHHRLFVEKFGYDILDFAYANEEMLSGIAYGRDEEFNVLEIGAGLGANMKWIASHYPKAHCVGVEPREALFRQVSGCEVVVRELGEILDNFKAPIFNVVIVNKEVLGNIKVEEMDRLPGVCLKGCQILPKNNPYKDFAWDKIKLVIWDMDDTFWKGTLSEGPVEVINGNVSLVKTLSRNGIINSISSKNDREPVEAKLKELGVLDYFVFNNINWESKGGQIKEKLASMGLRAENTLFIDDNVHNLEEAAYVNEALMTALPDIIPELKKYSDSLGNKDEDLKRLDRYKLLETKCIAKNEAKSNKDFLVDSRICITINKNCLEELDRITELVGRTNQLNYTKNRDSRELLEKLITNDWNDCAYIKASDRFGDYGIVGFYCFNTREGVMEHFLFSCRVLGMGIEQYIYNKLGCPKFTISEPVAVELESEKEISWISEDADGAVKFDSLIDKRVRILLKGPCDLSAVEAYLNGGNVTTEFNYINSQGFTTTGQNHSMHLWEILNLADKDISDIVSEVPFIVEGDFKTKMFEKEYNIVCYSLLQDSNAGLYRNKETGAYVAFSNCNTDITDSKVAAGILSGEIPAPHGFKFTEDILNEFAKSWEFVGRISDEDILRNLECIINNLKGSPKVMLLLGSEIPYEKECSMEYRGLCDYYKHINPVIKDYVKDKNNIQVIELTKYINSQEDYADCINHFSRDVYYKIADDIVSIINKNH